MTIQITHRNSAYMYKVSEDDKRILMVRLNRHGARWQVYGTFDSEIQAQVALLHLDAIEQDGEQG